MANSNRFFEVHNESLNFAMGWGVRIIVDRFTGVQYLVCATKQCSAPTVLLDQTGKPLLYQPPQG